MLLHDFGQLSLKDNPSEKEDLAVVILKVTVDVALTIRLI
jgi:hypothetical protein